VYGEHEVGGTSVLYISDVPFEELGFPTTLPDEPLPGYTWKITRLIPPAAAGVVACLATLYVRRRRYLLEAEGAEEQREGVTS
jgi:formate dehydrogenase iron-sulfur subunit